MPARAGVWHPESGDCVEGVGEFVGVAWGDFLEHDDEGVRLTRLPATRWLSQRARKL